MTRLAATMAVAGAAVYLLRLDPAAGLYVDDAWYIVLAHALWRGEGFRLISSATTPILPAFPPGFPMILAPVVGLFPEFPAGVLPMKMVSIAAMAGVGVASCRYLVRYHAAPGPAAVLVAAAAVLLPAFVFLAASTVMAEATFTLAQLCFALVVERAARREGARPIRSGVECGLIGAAMLLVRLAGIAAVAAAVLYLARTRARRTLPAFAITLAVCYAPWAAYAWANRQPLPQRLQHGGSIAFGYDELLLMRYGGEPGGGRVTPQELPGRIAFNTVNIVGRDAGAFVLPAAYRGVIESGLEVFLLSGETGFRATGIGGSAVMLVSLPASALILLGFAGVARRRATVAEFILPLTVAMVVLVPARSFRYLLPLSPFILFYFFSGIGMAVARLRRQPPAAFGAPFRIAVACVLALFMIEHAQYIRYARTGPQPAWLRDYEEVRNVTDWISAQADTSPVASSNPGLLYLATGRKTVALSNPRTHLGEWQRLGVRYAAALHAADKPPRSLGFTLRHESPRLKLWVMELPARADRK